jgi:hypothetical protein
MTALVRLGDRFRLTRDAEAVATFTQYAPAHTVGSTVCVPAGTVIVALDQVPGARAFYCYPEDYDAMEAVLVPVEHIASRSYAGGYALTFMVDDVRDLLEPIEPLEPRPEENRPPRLARLGRRSE